MTRVKTIFFVGRCVQKDYDKHGVWLGTVMKLDADGIYWVRYDNGDGEELDADEVNDLLIQDESEEGSEISRAGLTTKRQRAVRVKREDHKKPHAPLWKTASKTQPKKV